MTFPNPKLRFRRILTLEILLVAGYHLLGVLAGQEEPLGGVAQIVILHGQILGEDRSQIRRRQAVGEGTKRPGWAGCSFQSKQFPAANISSSNSTMDRTEACSRLTSSCTERPVVLKILPTKRTTSKKGIHRILVAGPCKKVKISIEFIAGREIAFKMHEGLGFWEYFALCTLTSYYI